MTRTELFTQLDELLELPAGTLKGDEKLESLESWNSMAMIGFIALADEHRGVRLSPRQFVNCNTVGDLAQLLGVES